MTRPVPALPAALPVLLLLLSGCAGVVEDCTEYHVFRWDAPGLYEALDDGVPWQLRNATAGPGLPAPDDAAFDRFGAARVSGIRYSDPEAPLRHATAHFGDPDTPARLVVTVPRDDDRPAPLFDALWDGLRFDADGAAVRAELLATRADTGHLVSYQAEVAPTPELEAWLAARGGVGAGNESTPQLGVVHVAWDDWRLELRVPWRAWEYDGQEEPHRLQAMPHGPAMLLVDVERGWSVDRASTWLRDHAQASGLPSDGLDGVERAPIERLCA